MAATYTLNSTTLVNGIGVQDDLILLTSVSNVAVGACLYITDAGETVTPGEQLKVIGFGTVSGWVRVKRGQEGSAASPHAATAVVWIAMCDQLYVTDPVGPPGQAVLVSPWINTLTGSIFWPWGDDTNPGSVRWWQKQVVTHSIGALGVRTVSTVGAQP